jgi:protein-tyrosine kinase
MGLVEQAAQRLEELRRAGVTVEELPAAPMPQRAPDARVTAVPPSHARTAAPGITLDLATLAANGFITPDVPRSQLADEYRVIKRPLLANASGSQIANAGLIMVTSSMPGEGKSFCSVNLAMSMAMEMNRTVLLVDADVARPSLPRLLGIPHMPGLMDVLDGKSVELSQVLMRTNVEKLTYLSSGRRDPRATEMLASDAMTAMLRELRTRYPERIVIFDSPPLLVTTEARVLATHMGQIVFVVAAEQTQRNDVKRALAAIEACPVKLLVLNKARTTGGGAYGYGYGYGN